MKQPNNKRVLLLGVGAFTHAVMTILKDSGAEVFAYLTRDYAQYPPSLAGKTYSINEYSDPCQLIQQLQIDFVIPMSIDWHEAPWADELISSKIPIFSPTGEAIKLEREREFGHQLCQQFGIPFPKSFIAHSPAEAEKIIRDHKTPFVIKNPLCSPTSPIHTVICETFEDSLSWVDRIDYSEGAFLQEYMGRREAGHIAFVSDGQIHSLVTNQEYKRAFNGNMGIVAGAPLGGLVEVDPEDKYGLAKSLLHPLLPWFRSVGYHGPVQVTACFRNGEWQVLEYNIRLGVTCAAMILRVLENPLENLQDVANNKTPDIRFKTGMKYACSLTLAGFGYPFIEVTGPFLPVRVLQDFDCDVWWNEVDIDENGEMVMTGHRIADIVAVGENLDDALKTAYRNIRKIRCVSSYYRTDIGMSLWPPGSD